MKDTELELSFVDDSVESCKIKKGDLLDAGIMSIEYAINKPNKVKDPISFEEINTCKKRSENKKVELCNLLNKECGSIAMDLSELGRTNLITMNIVEKPGSQPVAAKSYRMCPQERQHVNDLVKMYKELRFAKETDSPYARP